MASGDYIGPNGFFANDWTVGTATAGVPTTYVSYPTVESFECRCGKPLKRSTVATATSEISTGETVVKASRTGLVCEKCGLVAVLA
jgi:hypothetical protein